MKKIRIDRTLPVPDEFITRGSGKNKRKLYIRSYRDSLELKEIDPARIKATTMIREGEESISTEEFFKRLNKENYVSLDIMFFAHYAKNPKDIPTEWKLAKVVLFEGTRLFNSEESRMAYSWLLVYNEKEEKWYTHLEPIRLKKMRKEGYLTAVYIP